MHDKPRLNFIYFCIITIFLLYLLILAGGIVRSTGSGMGCPDWPKCFGLWIPPTDVSELPANFVEIYGKGGHLSVEFNVFKTWTEYINRLLGAVVGLSILVTLFFAFLQKSQNIIAFYSTLSAFVLVLFQGWLGAKVVSSNLSPYMISVHMIVALVILTLLIYSYTLISNYNPKITVVNGKIKIFIGFCCLLTIVQILIGSQVRQAVDIVAKQYNYSNQNLWIDSIGFILTFHRLFAYVVIAVNAYLIYLLNRNKLFLLRNLLISFVGLEVASGLVLVYFALPYLIQPIHLLFATLIFGLQFFMMVLVVRKYSHPSAIIIQS